MWNRNNDEKVKNKIKTAILRTKKYCFMPFLVLPIRHSVRYYYADQYFHTKIGVAQ